MKPITERAALYLIRATATRSVPNCINLDAIDRILADITSAGTSISGRAGDALLNEYPMPEYHAQGMGCGLEDRGITDRYEAMQYGWDEAVQRVENEVIQPLREALATATASPQEPADAALPDSLRAKFIREASRIVSEQQVVELRDGAGHGDFDAGAGQGRAFLAAEILAIFPTIVSTT